MSLVGQMRGQGGVGRSEPRPTKEKRRQNAVATSNRMRLDGGIGGGAGLRGRLGFFAEEGGDAVDDVVEAGARAEAGQSFELIDAGDAAHHVFETGLVGLDRKSHV